MVKNNGKNSLFFNENNGKFLLKWDDLWEKPTSFWKHPNCFPPRETHRKLTETPGPEALIGDVSPAVDMWVTWGRWRNVTFEQRKNIYDKKKTLGAKLTMERLTFLLLLLLLLLVVGCCC